MNSRYPDPRRVRTGGREQQSADGIRGIRGIRGIPWNPRMGSFFQFSIVKIGTLCVGPAPLSSKTPIFASHVQPSRSFVASKRSRAMFF